VINEVRYLGLILDKGLKWKAWLKNVMRKVCRAFWTCKDTSGKT
jgi:hypothetical protein